MPEKKKRRATSRQIAVTAARACDDKKVSEVIILDLRELTVLTDFFVIGSVRSDRQARAVNDELRPTLREKGYPPLGEEGLRTGKWALLDYGSVVVHLFQEDQREFYDLESLWGDAPRIDWKPKSRKKAE